MKKSSLKNKTFLVENIIDKTGQEWNENSKTDYFAKPIFLLKDTLTGQKIYYKYDKEYEHNFPFNTSKINYPADYFCSKIENSFFKCVITENEQLVMELIINIL